MRRLGLALTLGVAGLLAAGSVSASAATTTVGCTSGTFTITDGVVTGQADCVGTVTIPNTVTSIDDAAFQGATGVTSVGFEAPSSVTGIGGYAFFGASGLGSITIPSSVRTIGDLAFFGASSLATVTFSNGLEAIGDMAFTSTGLTSVSIPRTVTSVNRRSFYGAASLTSIAVAADNAAYSSDAEGVLFNKAKTTLIQYPRGRVATSYAVPGSVETIGRSAFNTATRLVTVSFASPSALKAIGPAAFESATSLASIVLPSALETIGNDAFYGATALARVYFEGLAAPIVEDEAFAEVASGATAYRYAGATGFTTAGSPPKWNGLLVADYSTAPADGPSPPAAVPAATSGATPAAAAAPPLSRVGQPKQTASGLSATIVAPGPGQVRMRVVANGARTWRAAPLAVCSASKRVTKAGRVTLTCSYPKAVRARLAKAPLKATLTLTFAPVSGAVSTSSSVVTIKRIRIATPKPVVSPGALPSRVTG